MSLREIQAADDWHRENDDEEVGDNVEARVCTVVTISFCYGDSIEFFYVQPHSKLVDASRWLSGPESVNWHASEDTAKDCPCAESENDTDRNPARKLESLRGKYS